MAYMLLVDRPPEPAGAEWWSENYTTTAELVEAMAATPEGVATWVWKPEGLELVIDLIDIECDTVLSVDEIIDSAADEFGVSRRLMHEIAWCESSKRPGAVNPQRTNFGHAQGLFQHLEDLWPARAAAVGSPGASPFDPVANARAAAWLMSEQGTRPWLASRGCWS